MKREMKKEEDKRIYVKPKLTKIDLAADEVLSTGCKLFSEGTAPLGTPCWANNCSLAGS
jgi:hypothetical protein